MEIRTEYEKCSNVSYSSVVRERVAKIDEELKLHCLSNQTVASDATCWPAIE